MAHLGVDVSINNRHPIDWHAAYSALTAGGNGQPFVWIKATEGTGYVSPSYGGDRAEANAAGFVTASYHFDDGAADPAAQIRWYLSTDPNGPWALDFESPQGNYSAHCQAMSDMLPQAAVYTYVALRRGMGWMAQRSVWLADPGNTGADIPRVARQDGPRPLAGFQNPVDFDEWQGSEADFAAYFRTAPPTTGENDMAVAIYFTFGLDPAHLGLFRSDRTWITHLGPASEVGGKNIVDQSCGAALTVVNFGRSTESVNEWRSFGRPIDSEAAAALGTPWPA